MCYHMVILITKQTGNSLAQTVVVHPQNVELALHLENAQIASSKNVVAGLQLIKQMLPLKSTKDMIFAHNSDLAL